MTVNRHILHLFSPHSYITQLLLLKVNNSGINQKLNFLPTLYNQFSNVTNVWPSFLEIRSQSTNLGLHSLPGLLVAAVTSEVLQ
jgi:hypothetical protein